MNEQERIVIEKAMIIAEKKAEKRLVENQHYIAIENIAKGDYVYIHFDGKVFCGNEYPFELRDGIAKRDIYLGQYVAYNDGNETSDLSVKPIMPSIEEAFGRTLQNENN